MQEIWLYPIVFPTNFLKQKLQSSRSELIPVCIINEAIVLKTLCKTLNKSSGKELMNTIISRGCMRGQCEWLWSDY